MTDWSRLQIFLSSYDGAVARFVARLTASAWDADSGDLDLAGQIEGPFSSFGRTLPAVAQFTPRSEGRTAAASAVVVEPCAWTAESPMTYRARLTLRRAGAIIDAHERVVGIRLVDIRQGRLRCEGKPWVIRGVHCDNAAPANLADWRAVAAAMVVRSPDEALCAEATRLGVWIVAEVDGTPTEIVNVLHRLARWPCIALTIVAGDPALLPRWREQPDQADLATLLVAQRIRAAGSNLLGAVWADLIAYESDSADAIAAAAAATDVPVIALRPDHSAGDIASNRLACDALQRDLAGRGEFVGYIV